MHGTALGHLPHLRLAMHTLILLSSSNNAQKNDTENTEERLTQCRSLSSLFAFFPAPHVSQSLLFTFLFPKAISKIARLARLFLQLLLSSALDSSDSVERLADKGRRYKRNGRELNS